MHHALHRPLSPWNLLSNYYLAFQMTLCLASLLARTQSFRRTGYQMSLGNGGDWNSMLGLNGTAMQPVASRVYQQNHSSVAVAMLPNSSQRLHPALLQRQANSSRVAAGPRNVSSERNLE